MLSFIILVLYAHLFNAMQGKNEIKKLEWNIGDIIKVKDNCEFSPSISEETYINYGLDAKYKTVTPDQRFRVIALDTEDEQYSSDEPVFVIQADTYEDHDIYIYILPEEMNNFRKIETEKFIQLYMKQYDKWNGNELNHDVEEFTPQFSSYVNNSQEAFNMNQYSMWNNNERNHVANGIKSKNELVALPLQKEQIGLLLCKYAELLGLPKEEFQFCSHKYWIDKQKSTLNFVHRHRYGNNWIMDKSALSEYIMLWIDQQFKERLSKNSYQKEQTGFFGQAGDRVVILRSFETDDLQNKYVQLNPGNKFMIRNLHIDGNIYMSKINRRNKTKMLDIVIYPKDFDKIQVRNSFHKKFSVEVGDTIIILESFASKQINNFDMSVLPELSCLSQGDKFVVIDIINNEKVIYVQNFVNPKKGVYAINVHYRDFDKIKVVEKNDTSTIITKNWFKKKAKFLGEVGDTIIILQSFESKQMNNKTLLKGLSFLYQGNKFVVMKTNHNGIGRGCSNKRCIYVKSLVNPRKNINAIAIYAQDFDKIKVVEKEFSKAIPNIDAEAILHEIDDADEGEILFDEFSQWEKMMNSDFDGDKEFEFSKVMPIIDAEATFHEIDEKNGGQILFDEFSWWFHDDKEFIQSEFPKVMPIINDEAVFHKIGENNGGKILFDEFAGWERGEQKFVPKEFVQIFDKEENNLSDVKDIEKIKEFVPSMKTNDIKDPEIPNKTD